MISLQATESHFYQDTSRLRNLKGKAGLEAAASEFEAMFLQLVLKNMRDATQAMADEDSFLSSRQQQFYQSMADGQLATEMASKAKLGIAEAMTRQLGHHLAGAGEGSVALKNDQGAVASSSISTAALRQPLIRTADGN
ncbi:rod-binding protein [Gallaecimonas xiamenensis]|uniref:Flagellar protein n=1 Tax=Gallaecimonas xiamenensis 3-C-1 TaxID=745411 RepID=K2IUJ1_9GAMM|nr:rod-binding protein [Gallaecimonas xiamenensis]EKE73981.1 flagellar protein [Gallaecimonas xiamenensis 3-C-1]